MVGCVHDILTATLSSAARRRPLRDAALLTQMAVHQLSDAHAPLAVMLMVAEMTCNLSILAPAMIAVGISVIIVGETTIYTSQVDTRADSPALWLQFSFPLLSTLAVRQAMTPPLLHFSPRQTVAEALLAECTVSGAPVLDGHGNLLRVLTVADIERIPLSNRSQRHVEEAMNREVLVVQPDETLDVALEQLTGHRIGWMPVLEIEVATGGRQVVGHVTAFYRAGHRQAKRVMIGGQSIYIDLLPICMMLYKGAMYMDIAMKSH